MHKVLILGGGLLCSCASVEPAARGETAGHICTAAGSEQFLGKLGSSDLGTAILRTTNSAVLRWAPFGAALTMDYRLDRVTVYLSADNKVSRISCG